MLRRAIVSALVVIALVLASPAPRAATDTLPASLSDRDFWSMTEQMSEANGYYLSDNLTSNEMALSAVAATLARRVKPDGVYLGVGPEQNFTYIAAMRPKIAFITDIRRGNLHLQLMYKALFELSSDRADFLSRLFTKPRPAGLSSTSTAADLFDAYWDVLTSDMATYKKNLQSILDVLTKTHGFHLSQQDLTGVEYVYYAFYWHGPRIDWASTNGMQTPLSTSFTTLMRSTDQASGQERGFLSTEENFAFLKALQQKNLIVPIVGDFGGAKALRAIGQYLKDHGAVVTAFYVSDVEPVLRIDGKTNAFCANVASLPLDETSIFIRPGPPATQRPMLDFLVFTPGPGGGFTATTTSTSPGMPANVTHAFMFPPGALAPIVPEVAGCVGK